MPRILLSAVACDPVGGSEGGFGWHALPTILKRHEVVVITYARQQPLWAEGKARGLVPDGLEVHFLGEQADWHPNRLPADFWSVPVENRAVKGIGAEVTQSCADEAALFCNRTVLLKSSII